MCENVYGTSYAGVWQASPGEVGQAVKVSVQILVHCVPTTNCTSGNRLHLKPAIGISTEHGSIA